MEMIVKLWQHKCVTIWKVAVETVNVMSQLMVNASALQTGMALIVLSLHMTLCHTICQSKVQSGNITKKKQVMVLFQFQSQAIKLLIFIL